MLAKVGYRRKGKAYLVESEKQYFSNETGVAIKPDFQFALPGAQVETEETNVNHCFFNKALEEV